jgi:hypothetical protein
MTTRLLLLSAFQLFSFSAFAVTPVVFTNAHFTGTRNNSRITITPAAANNPQVVSNVTVAGVPISLIPTNGVARTNLVAGDYTVSLAGIARTWTISVPDSATEQNAAALANLTTYTFTNIPLRFLNPGTNVTFTTNPPGTVTINAIAGTGAADVTLSQQAWTSNLLWLAGEQAATNAALRVSNSAPHVAAGTNIIAVTNGGVVTIHGTATGSGSASQDLTATNLIVPHGLGNPTTTTNEGSLFWQSNKRYLGVHDNSGAYRYVALLQGGAAKTSPADSANELYAESNWGTMTNGTLYSTGITLQVQNDAMTIVDNVNAAASVEFQSGTGVTFAQRPMVAFGTQDRNVLTDADLTNTWYGSFIGDGASLTNLPASTLPAYAVTNGQENVSLATPFSVSGTEALLSMANDRWRLRASQSDSLFTIENDNLSAPLISLDYSGTRYTNTHASNFFSGVLYADGAGLSNVVADDSMRLAADEWATNRITAAVTNNQTTAVTLMNNLNVSGNTTLSNVVTVTTNITVTGTGNNIFTGPLISSNSVRSRTIHLYSTPGSYDYVGIEGNAVNPAFGIKMGSGYIFHALNPGAQSDTMLIGYSSADRISISGGLVGIGVNPATQKLDVGGNALIRTNLVVSNSVTATSMIQPSNSTWYAVTSTLPNWGSALVHSNGTGAWWTIHNQNGVFMFKEAIPVP